MNEDMLCWLTFSKYGPPQELLMLNKGENVTLTIEKGKFPETEGSPENKEWYDYGRKTRKVRLKIDSLTNVLGTSTDSLVQRHLADDIKKLKDSLNFKMMLEEFKNLKTPKMFLNNIRYDVTGFPKKTVDSLVTVMKQRFPDNQRVQEYPREPQYPPATQQSMKAYKRYQQILTIRTGHSFKRPATPRLSDEQNKMISQIKPLKLGDKVAPLSFKGLNGKIIALKDIHTPYVLIDFWASWCTPCREEVPDLKLIQAKYKGRLTVYAVSLDKNKSNWSNAIRIDKSSMLTQVIADTTEFTLKKITKLFGIQFIPRNFLLDQHRKIIAINIPGDSLEQKIEKLCGE
jgi:thiol-disulfide isomerase/thioredoxin